MQCIFCDIAAGKQRAKIVYEDDRAVAFHDIDPKAPTHILIIPRKHIDGPLSVDDSNETIIGHLLTVAAEVARQIGIADSGYRLVVNQGQDGGQSVFHLHFHLLAGRRLVWPPG